jgi:hypothetical protein
MSAHTPGPLDNVLQDVVLTDAERRLIASAPDMLRALKDMLAWYDGETPKMTVYQWRGIVAKAEGRS